MIRQCFALLLLGIFSSNGEACNLAFHGGTPSIDLSMSSDFSAEPVLNRVSIEVKNATNEPCKFFLGLKAKEIERRDFPPGTTVIGPGGQFKLSQTSGSKSGMSSHVVGPNSNLKIDYTFVFLPSWNNKEGVYSRDLLFTIFSNPALPAIDQVLSKLTITVPSITHIRFAGNTDRLDLGNLSPRQPTTSPPFALKIYSTAPYQLSVQSNNRGRLEREGGGASIPYRLMLGGKQINLSSRGDVVILGQPTHAFGDTKSVVVTVPPYDNALAGAYSDRITVSVTTL